MAMWMIWGQTLYNAHALWMPSFTKIYNIMVKVLLWDVITIKLNEWINEYTLKILI